MLDKSLQSAERRMQTEEIAALFNLLFSSSTSVYHQATSFYYGGSEPYYQSWSRTASRLVQPARLISREDFPSSALHEISHWCIAGIVRRSQDDFAYWYQPEGRSEQNQQRFYQAERIPQAIECLFSKSAGITFRPSFDDFNDSEQSETMRRRFVRSVDLQVAEFRKKPERLPYRARIFLANLKKASSAGLIKVKTQKHEEYMLSRFVDESQAKRFFSSSLVEPFNHIAL